MRQATHEASKAAVSSGVNVDDAILLFKKSLQAANLSERTVQTYTESVRQLSAFLMGQGMPTDIAHISREHCESFISHLLTQWKDSTANNRYRGCQAFFRWCERMGEIKESPMVNMRPPKMEEHRPQVLKDEELAALLATCEKGLGLADRRDYAILRVFIDTGMRRAELANLRYSEREGEPCDIDLEFKLRDNRDKGDAGGVITVMGKGGKERRMRVGAKTAEAIGRYLLRRRRSRHAGEPELWLSSKGKLTDSGVAQMVKRRGRQAGLGGKVHAHLFRHWFAHTWQKKGESESALMAAAGWSSREMVSRYAASAAEERSWDAHKRLSPGDKL